MVTFPNVSPTCVVSTSPMMPEATPPQLCPDNAIDYEAQVYGCGVCATDEQIVSFMRLHEELQAPIGSTIVYHGIHPCTYLPYVEYGFRVPKTSQGCGPQWNGMVSSLHSTQSTVQSFRIKHAPICVYCAVLPHL
jgi:hypothetical protein